MSIGPFILASVFTTGCVAAEATPAEADDDARGRGTFTAAEIPKTVRNLNDPESGGAPGDAKKDEKPPHIVEKTGMKGRMVSGLPCGATDDGAVVVKTFFARMATYPDIRFREFFDPRYLKKHGLTDREIAFEIVNLQGIENLQVADDNLTVLVEVRGQGGKEAFIMRCAVYEGQACTSRRRKRPTRKPASSSLGFCGRG